ncbi:MAG: dihydroneopterin triphosphate diphosphatase [Rhodocyclaceae bacterium]|nr:dihydroneopterin triphosphate diphosphatase [Rhodocyclaceae bacterium]
MPHKLPRSVLVLIHSPELDILLLERASHPGFWQSVTGSQEGGETLLQTAQREVAEETGLAVAPHRLRDWGLSNRYEIYPLWRHRYAPGVTHNTEHVFSLCVARDSAIRLAPDEHLAWRWLDRHAAARAVFSWSNRDAILMLDCRGPYAAG